MAVATPPVRKDRPSGARSVGDVVAKSGLSVEEFGFGYGPFGLSVFTFNNMKVTMTDEPGVILYGGQKLYDFPEGLICVLAAIADLDILGTGNVIANFDGKFAVGVAPASNNDTLTSAEANIIPSTAMPQAAAGVTTANGFGAAAQLPAYLGGTATPIDLYLNFLVDDSDHDGGGITVTGGTLKVYWVFVGDF